MKHIYVLLFTALIAIHSIAADKSEELTDSNFDARLNEVETALVMFYAPWCGHCKHLKPEFEKAAGILLENDPPVSLMKVDCTEAGKEVCGRLSVSGYPTLKLFRGSSEDPEEYNGPREADGIVKYLRSKVGPAFKKLNNQAELDALLLKAQGVVVVSYIKDDAAAKVFVSVASVLREEVVFAELESADKKSIVLYRPQHLNSKLEENTLEYSGDLNIKEIKEWILKNYHGLAGHRTPSNVKGFNTPLVMVYYAVDYAKNIKGTNYWRNRVMKVAKSFASLNFAICNIDEFGQETSEFGIESHMAKGKPLVGVKDAVGKKYVMTEEFSIDNLKAFLTKYENGEISAHVKSEDIPEDNDEASVKVAVGKNFESLVTDSKKDVLIEFYAPWCGHCKKLTPIYDELGDKMVSEQVEIVKMDATANDVPSDYKVQGFPTLYWLPSDTKKPVVYDGGRDVDAFIKYIAEHSTQELFGYTRDGKPRKQEL